MNTKATLEKLHKELPELDTETLLKILDCYVEEDINSNKPIVNPPLPWTKDLFIGTNSALNPWCGYNPVYGD